MAHVEDPKYWDNRWERQGFGLQNDAALLYVAEKVLSSLEGKRTLEVASGRGIDSIRMAQKGAEAFVVDFSKGALQVTHLLAEQTNTVVRKTQANAGALPFVDNSFDLVFSQGLMEHPGNREEFLREQARVVKPGGFVIVDMPNTFCIQTPIREAQVRLGIWPQGKEYPMTGAQISTMVREVGLDPVKQYGWDLMPLLNLGLRDRLRGKRVSEPLNVQKVQLGEPPAPSGFTKHIEASVGHLFLNNVGVVAQKKY